MLHDLKEKTPETPMYLCSSDDIRNINFWSIFPSCHPSYYPLWIQNTQDFCTVCVVMCFSFVFPLPSCPLSFIFLLWYTSCSMRNKALDQKYSNLCAYARSRACLLSMKSGSDASWLSATLCQPRRESWHLARGPPARKAFPSPCLVVSSSPLTDRAASLCVDRHPFPMPRRQMERKK